MKILFFLLFPALANATIYFTAYDRVSGTIALVYSSSGGNFWQTKVHGKGLVGEQGSGLCEEAKPAQVLAQETSARGVTESLVRTCDAVRDFHQYYRLAAITVDGEMSHALGPRGCNETNIHCGMLQGNDFEVSGGGLEAGVLEAAVNAWATMPQDLDFRCKLLTVMSTIYRSGGEIKTFRGASITLDNPAWTKIKDFSTRFNQTEWGMLETLQAQLRQDGIECHLGMAP